MSSAFRIHHVSKTFSHFALQDITMSLPRGQVMGLIGPNGSGKSTTIRILMGLLERDAGVVEVLGRPIPEDRVSTMHQVGFVSNEMELYERATVAWHLKFVKSFYPRWDDPYASVLVSRFGLIPELRVKQLSHGQRLKLALLLSLARRPELLILDEPTGGLDPIARQQVLTELLDLIQDEARAVLFSTHHTPDVEQIADLVTIIQNGRLVVSDTTDMYLDRWKRLRVDLDPSKQIPLPPQSTLTSQVGRHHVLITSNFSDDLVAWLTHHGAEILEVQSLSLDEALGYQLAQQGEDP